MKGEVKKVVLAYSGGLDTSVILKWLKNEFGCEVICLHRRYWPGRRIGSPGGKGQINRGQQGLHRGPQRGVRARLRFYSLKSQCHL